VSDTASVRVFLPSGGRTATAALLWIHGGGLVMGSAKQDDRFCRAVAERLGLFVASVDYRLAPEHPYPAALDDCMAGLRWLLEARGFAPQRVAVGGDSAGGGLAAAVALRHRDSGAQTLAFQLLAYPMLDDRTTLRTEFDAPQVRKRMRMWSPDSNRFGWNAYLNGGAGDGQAVPYAAPARAEDVRDLPPAWIGVGSNDLFHDEDVIYAQRLTDAGVPCELVVVPGAYHGFDLVQQRAAVSKQFTSAKVAALGAGLGVQQ
jgi:acetyl esterase/lipase